MPAPRRSVVLYPYTVRITFRLPGFDGVHNDYGAYKDEARAILVCDKWCADWGSMFDRHVPSAIFSVIDCRSGVHTHRVWYDATNGVHDVDWYQQEHPRRR